MFSPADTSCDQSVSVFPVSQEASLDYRFAVQIKWPRLGRVMPLLRASGKGGTSFSLGCVLKFTQPALPPLKANLVLAK